MTEIQCTNISLANFIIDELHKDKPVVLKLDVEQAKVFWTLMNEHKMYGIHLPVVKSGFITLIEIRESNAEKIHHMLSSYVAKHDQYGVVRSLGEVS